MKKQLPINQQLTPENAHELGLTWHSDTMYDPEAPAIANQSFWEWIEDGGVIGQAAHMFMDNAVGLYQPIHDNLPEQKSVPNTDHQESKTNPASDIY